MPGGEALARREALSQMSATPVAAKLRHLSALVGLDIRPDRLDTPLSAAERASLRGHFGAQHQYGRTPYASNCPSVTQRLYEEPGLVFGRPVEWSEDRGTAPIARPGETSAVAPAYAGNQRFNVSKS